MQVSTYKGALQVRYPHQIISYLPLYCHPFPFPPSSSSPSFFLSFLPSLLSLTSFLPFLLSFPLSFLPSLPFFLFFRCLFIFLIHLPIFFLLLGASFFRLFVDSFLLFLILLITLCFSSLILHHPFFLSLHSSISNFLLLLLFPYIPANITPFRLLRTYLCSLLLLRALSFPHFSLPQHLHCPILRA